MNYIKVLCDNGCLHTMNKGKNKCFLVNVYNQMKEIFIKDWKEKRLLRPYSREDIPNLTGHEISESNIKCEICTIQLWNDT